MRTLLLPQAFFGLFVALFFLASSLRAQPQYSVVDLGVLTSGTGSSFAMKINDSGQVTGYSSGENSTWEAFIWDAQSGMIGIGGNQTSRGWGINESGRIGGQYHQTAMTWDAENGRSDLGSLPGFHGSIGYNINDLDEVVGQATAGTGPRAFFYSGGVMTNIGELPGGEDKSYAFGVNNLGQVVGESESDLGTRAFIWDSTNGMVDLGAFEGGSGYSRAESINNSGFVTGRSNTSSGTHAFLWDETEGFRDLGALPGGSSWGYDVSDNNLVVGVSSYVVQGDTERAAFLWDSTFGIQNLNDLLDGSGIGWDLTEARGVNSSGQIVGWGEHNGKIRGFLLTPTSVPEPAQFLILGLVGLIGTTRYRRRIQATD